MTSITLRGNEIQLSGDLPAVGSQIPDFSLVGSNWAEVSKESLAGQNVVLSIFPSVDTATCAASVRAFNEQAAGLDNTTVVCVSADLPPAAARFCGAEGIENVVTGSTYRNPELLNTLGLRMVDGLLAGLAARAVLVIDANGVVQHSQLVAELSEEPDYDAALAALRS
jgi:thiol peroxidase